MDQPKRKLLYRFQGENYVEVVDEGDYRSLYFQNSVVQSRIYNATPAKLALRYTQYMMAASLLALPHPKKVLLIGVGAGALLHFFHQFLPDASVEGVDNSQDILDIARRFFSLPENKQISVHCDDGLDYLLRHDQKRYDLILVDAFNDGGMARGIYSPEFFKTAGKRLSQEGVVCCNLWSGSRKHYGHVRKALEQNSASQVFIPVRRRENVIALLFQCDLPWRSLYPAKSTLQRLNDKYGIDFKEVSAAAKKHNMKIGEQLQLWLR